MARAEDGEAVDAIDGRRLLDDLSVAVVAADDGGRIVYTNGAAEALLGWPARALVGRPLDDLIPEHRRPAAGPPWSRPDDGPEPGPFPMPVRRPDGSEVELEWTLARPAEPVEGGRRVVATLRAGRAVSGPEPEAGHARYLRTMARVAAGLSARLDPDQILETFVQTLVEDFDVAQARVWIAEEATGALVLRARAGLPDPAAAGSEEPVRTDHDPDQVAEVARTRRPLVRQAEPGREPDLPDGGPRPPFRAVATLPLLAGGELRGVVACARRVAIAPETVDALAAFAAITAAALADAEGFRREQAARAEAEDQRRKLQAILDTIPIGVVLAEGPAGALTLVNPATEQLLGAPVAAASLAEFYARFPMDRADGRPCSPEDRPMAASWRTGARVQGRFRYRRPGGQSAILEILASPFPGPAGGAVSIYSDITERLRLEADLAERAAQWRALLDHLPVGVAYFDAEGICRACNGPARRFLGRPRTEVLGVAAAELIARAPELRAALERCLRERTRHVQDAVTWSDPAGGAVRHLEWRFEPLPAPEPGRTRGALALMIDVTDRTRVEETLQRARDEAEGASRRKTQFLSAVSHDLRTPVNALSLQADLLGHLVEGRGDDPELTLLAGEVRNVATNLIELINDLLDLTRFDSGSVDYHISDFALEDWLATTLAPLELTALAKGLAFAWKADRRGRMVRGDRVKMGRVLVNLVGNAVKFTESGQVEVTAGVAPDGGLAIVVRDTGPGIPEDQLGPIFDEFAQLRNPERDRTKGTGLGLAICRRLVEGVAGRLSVVSRPGVGSRFTAWYPPDHLASIGPPTPPPSSSTLTPAPRPTASGPILLVEDDPSSRRAMARLLERSGYAVALAASGPEALEVLGRVRPAIVLLDLMLPGMDGSEVLRQIRATPAWKDLKVVVLSGDLIGGRSADLRALDVDGLLAKPVDFEMLLSVVGRYVPPGPPAEAG